MNVKGTEFNFRNFSLDMNSIAYHKPQTVRNSKNKLSSDVSRKGVLVSRIGDRVPFHFWEITDDDFLCFFPDGLRLKMKIRSTW